jgi:hypothetical protein
MTFWAAKSDESLQAPTVREGDTEGPAAAQR